MQLKAVLVFGLAASLADAGSSIYSTSLCMTYSGSKSVKPVPTSSSVVTKSYAITGKTTSCKTTTVTPKPVTKTTVLYSTSTSTSTVIITKGTLTSTSTVFQTSTNTITEIESTTVTATETSTTISTTTASTSPGYTPIQSQISSLGFRPAKRNALALDAKPLPVDIRAAQPMPIPAATSAAQGALAAQAKAGNSYPTKVYCLAKVQTINTVSTQTVTGAVITRTAKPSTVYITKTSIVKVCKTVAQTSTATATITSTSTSIVGTDVTSTTTSIVSTTTTEVVNGPFATVYPVCQPNNYLRTINGALVHNIFDERSIAYGPEGLTIEQCCNSCQELGNACAAGYLSYGYYCVYVSQADGSCDGTQDVVGFDTRIVDTNEIYRLFNGNCGRFRYYDSDPEPHP